jgi:hypothetical protein
MPRKTKRLARQTTRAKARRSRNGDAAAGDATRGRLEGRTALQAAAAALRIEVDAIVADEGALPPALLLVLDDALAELVSRALPEAERAQVRVAAAAAANAARDRQLPELAVEAARRRGHREATATLVRWPAFSEVNATVR